MGISALQNKFYYMKNGLTSYIKENTEVTVLIKVIFSTLAGIFAGAGFIGFISEYATYYYAYSYGVRLPIESVPYLSVAVTLVSIIMLFSTVLIFLSFIMYFKVIDFAVKKISALMKYNTNIEISIRLEGILATGLFVLTIILIVMLYYFNFTDRHQVYFKVVPVPSRLESFLSIIATLTIIVVLLLVPYIIHTKKHLKSYFYLLLILFEVIFISANVFNSDIYGGFLRQAKLGGGIEVTVHTKEEKLQGNLFLLTKDNLIIFKPKESKLIEIPKGRIQKYSYARTSTWEVPVKDVDSTNRVYLDVPKFP